MDGGAWRLNGKKVVSRQHERADENQGQRTRAGKAGQSQRLPPLSSPGWERVEEEEGAYF